MKKPRAQQPPSSTPPRPKRQHNPQNLGDPELASKQTKVVRLQNVYLLASAGRQKGSKSKHWLAFALPRVREGCHTIARTHKVIVWLLLSLLQGFFYRASGLLLDACVLERLSRAVVAFSLVQPPEQAGSRERLGALAVPSIRTHLRFSSCDPGRTLSGRSRLLLYRPECDNSFSCKAVIFPYLEEGCFFFKGEEGCFGFGLGFFPPPLPAVVPRSAPAKMPGEQRLGGVSAHLRPPQPPTSAGRQGRHPPSCFLFLVGTHPPKGHHISFITRSHLRDACDQLTPFSPAFLQLSPPQQARPCPVLGKAGGSPSASAQSYTSLDCNELFTLSCSNS